MIIESTKRVRRTPADARKHILFSAEKIMIERGIKSVQVRAVARAAGMTDAGINHHFGSLEGLLEALLSEGAQKVRKAVDQIVLDWVQSTPNISALVDAISGLYKDGYAELAVHLHKSGWQERGSALLDPVVEPLLSINSNPRTTETDIRVALASLHLWLAFDPLYGSEFRRSVGLYSESDQALQSEWWTNVLAEMLTE
ncbi:TetR/AcrR family transcriptional regulator [Sphingorhabdus sp. EL138]|uniref:TetR/AcrR family transcriptional regulator n=1 Tax=Sphingorhabdus sp. EL138 TaxID=2073156 RepID=UPI0013A54EF4|nr:helix-turn-helix domain-containing protein [Sphingorhabdus sp. EL138]